MVEWLLGYMRVFLDRISLHISRISIDYIHETYISGSFGSNWRKENELTKGNKGKGKE